MANTTRSVKRVTIPTSTGAEWVNPAENPEAANQAIAQVLGEASRPDMPEIPMPIEDIVTLPGGLLINDDIVTKVQVRELTGEDEESLAKASQSTNPLVFIDRLLKCGIVRIGDAAPSETEKLLAQMLVGDREAVVLGIRKATYGNDIEVPEWVCPSCGKKTSLEMEVSDIPMTEMKDPRNDQQFKVSLRKGGYALVKLANGADQLAIFDKPDLTQAQRETVLLSRCVVSLVDKSGHEIMMAAFPSMSRTMSVPDRHAILREMGKRQPGPKYDQVSYRCENCDTDQFVAVTISHLFLDFGWI